MNRQRGRRWLVLGAVLSACEPAEVITEVIEPPAPYEETTTSLTSWRQVAELEAGDQAQFGRNVAVTRTHLYVSQINNTNPSLFAFDRTSPYDLSGALSLPEDLGIMAIAALVGDEREVWVGGGGQVARLSPDLSEIRGTLRPDGASTEFGWAVAANDDWLVVGDPAVDERTGRVYVFERVDLEAQPLMIRPESVVEGDGFGAALALDGNRLLVGAPHRRLNPGVCTAEACRGKVFILELGRTDLRARPYMAPESTAQSFGTHVAWLDGLPVVAAPLSHACLPEGQSCRGEDEAQPSICAPGETLCRHVGQVYVEAAGGGWVRALPETPRTERQRGEGGSLSVGKGWIAVGSPRDAFRGGHGDQLVGSLGWGAVQLVPWPKEGREVIDLTPNSSDAGMRFGTQAILDGEGLLFASAPNRCGRLANCQGRGTVLIFQQPE